MTTTETAALLRSHDRFLILTHVRPDGDTIGCAAALCAALQNLGKTAYVLENPELTATCAAYVTPYHAPANYVPDYVITTDVASLGLLPDNARPYQHRINLAIDHHPSYEGFATDGSCVRSECAAAGEIVYEIVRELGEITPVMATALYCALSTDTGCFVYNNTTANTHRVAAELIDAGCDVQGVNKRHFRTKTLYCALSTDTGCFVYNNTTANTHRVAAELIDAGCDVQGVNKRHFRTKSRVRIALESAIMSAVEFYDHDRIAVVTVPQALLQQLGATPDDAEEIASMAGVIEGVDCALTVRELVSGESKISLRTGSRVNATEVCRMLGGGGHAQAAGATMDCPLAEAKQRALDAIARVAGED